VSSTHWLVPPHMVGSVVALFILQVHRSRYAEIQYLVNIFLWSSLKANINDEFVFLIYVVNLYL
jgi:hypothetical protein